MASDALLEFIQRYGPQAGEEGPVLFSQEVFGVKLDPWQKDVARDYGREERRISIRACHGPGKTFLAALLIWHQMLCRFPQHTVVTAPSRGQLEDALVKEVLTLYSKLPPALQELYEVKKNRIELRSAKDESFFSARTAREEKPEALQGVHCDGGYVLLIADEASGVGEQIFEAAAGSMSGHNATTLLLSNPVRTSGFFFDTHNKLNDMWRTYQVRAQDSPRVSDDFVYDIARRYGEDSAAYRVRVLGEFPLADLDTVIPFEFVESARNRDIVIPKGISTIWGLDVARYGDDRNALIKRSTLAVMPDILEWGGVDLMQTAGKVKAEWDETSPHDRPDEILVDVIGLGAGVTDRLRELGLPARGVNVSETASYTERYRNLRAELWFAAREWLSKRDRSLPRCEGGCATDCLHERLAQELVVPKYTYASSGKVQIESKSDMKKRGYKSPNIAEAFILSFSSEPASLIHGSAKGFDVGLNWGEPVHRNRMHV
jgi:hypothetical protein